MNTAKLIPIRESQVDDRDVMLDVEGLSKTYHTREGTMVEALQSASFTLREGEFVTVVGPSGCGKTTLLKILAGILERSHGSIRLNGVEMSGPSRDIGVVFQAAVLLPWRTVLQNVMVPVEIQGRDRKLHEDKARQLLEMAGLAGFESKYPSELSGGMQQRVGICRALIHDPSFLLMDEPFGALDAMTREQMNLELLRIWRDRRKTVMLVTHSIPEAVFLADKVIVMSPRPGRISGILDIDLARPRRLEMMNSPAFGRYVSAIRAHFGSEGGMD